VSVNAIAGSFISVCKAATSYAFRPRPPGQSFDSSGVPIHYTDEGRGTPVVLIHGFAVNERLNWRLPGVTRMLARDLRVISIDVRGHGRSGKPHATTSYGLNLVEDVLRLLDHLGLERAHVVGYSLGGFIALKLATVSPERLLSVGVLGAGWEPPANAAFLEALPKLADDLEAGKGVGPLMGNLGDERRKPGLLHWLWVKLLTRYFNDPKALIALIRSAPLLSVSEDELRDIKLAVCSIVGSRDPLTVSVDAMRGKLVDHTVLVVEGADHLGAPMQPAFHDQLRSFLLR
jgi:pimeloyl-ACP methyl ester carboxylesterase